MAVAERVIRPAFRSVPEFTVTNGDVAAHVGEMVGLTPDANQRDILDVIYAEARPGRLACFEVGVIAPRQNIKSSTLEVAALTDLIVFRKPLNIWTAHLYKTTRGAFRDMVNRIDASDALRRQCKKPTTANGNEAIELLTGERIEFHARSKGGGRGLTGDTVTLDEALLLADAEMGALLPTMATRINGQVRYGSSAGLATSEVLRGVRDRGREGTDSTLGYLEWCAPMTSCATSRCDHRIGTPGCALDDESLWWPANPALGDRISLDTLRKLRRSLPAGEFAREFLGWWDEPALSAVVIPHSAWIRLAANPPEGVPAAFAVDMTPDRQWASIGVFCDGHVDIVEHRPAGEWLVESCRQLSGRSRIPVAVDQRGPAAAMIQQLRDAHVHVVEVNTTDYVRACGSFYDAVIQETLTHSAHTDLDSAVSGATKRNVGDGWAWDRKGESVISPLVAVTLARWVGAQRREPSIRSIDSGEPT